MPTDKQLIREGKYFEALGDNYNSNPIYVMLFEGTKKLHNGFRVSLDNPLGKWSGHCISHLKDGEQDINFSSVKSAKKWIKKNTEPLPENQWYSYGNHNADWL